MIQELCLIRGKTVVAMVTDNYMPKEIKHCVATMEGSVFSHTGNNWATSFSLPVNVPLVRLNYSFNCLLWLHDYVNSSLYSYFQVRSAFHYPDITLTWKKKIIIKLHSHHIFVIIAMILLRRMFDTNYGLFPLLLQSTTLQAFGNLLTWCDCLLSPTHCSLVSLWHHFNSE